jgi:hypothetical protein
MQENVKAQSNESRISTSTDKKRLYKPETEKVQRHEKAQIGSAIITCQTNYDSGFAKDTAKISTVSNIPQKNEKNVKNQTKILPDNQKLEKKFIKKPKTNQKLIASLHVGGGFTGVIGNEKFDKAQSPLASDNAEFSDGSSGLSNDRAEQSLEELLKEYPTINYLPPISAGFSVRKNFTERIALETGLFYTYLQTNFSHNYYDYRFQKATLKVHYLGIPINLIVNIINNPKWNLYFSVGGAIEKGLRLDYEKVTTYSYSTAVYRQHLNDKVQRVQFSVNASVGVAARIYKGFGIYFEPRFGYYFKNRQPLNIRTASPFNIGLNAGIRYEF